MRGFWIFCLLAACGIVFCVSAMGCKTVPAVTTACLPLKAYTPAEQQQLAAEVAALPPGSALVGAMSDYAAMRAADRACRK